MTREEAIHVVKSNWPEGRYMLSEALQTLIPELKESEDKWIKREIINYLKEKGDFRSCWISWLEKQDVKTIKEALRTEYEKGRADAIAEFEKQGEQKPVDNVKPKFKVGDWIISDEAHEDFRICKIIEVGNGNYKIESIHGYKGYNEYKVFDSIYRLWTIEDAKSGDVLASSTGAFIYNGRNDGSSCPGSYCGINTLGQFKICDTNHWTGKKVYPATKEQCDLLFQKMKEAGYEWDSEKLELKKINKDNIRTEEENNRVDYVVETDEKGVDWYVCQHWYHQHNSSRKLKEGDIINFEGTHENGMMLIRSFDYDSDFAARSYCQIYVWNKELHYSEGVQFGSNMAPGINKFSLASADDIQVFFNTIKKEFPREFDNYFGQDSKYREMYAKYID